MKRIQSKLHRIEPYDVCKIYLSCFDDNRYILDDDINSLTYFYKDIRSQWNWVKWMKSIKSVKLIRLIKSNQVNKKFTTYALF